MAYIVITKYNKATDTCLCVTVSEDTFDVTSNTAEVRRVDLGGLIKSQGLRPLNFSIDREGGVLEDCGVFTRFSDTGCAVVLAELKTNRGKTLGYRLLSCANNQVVNLKTEDIIARSEAQSNPFLQNGIVRNNTVNCYPLHKYPVMKIGSAKQTTSVKPQIVAPTRPVSTKKANVSFSNEQSTELKRCKDKGIDPKLISNPNLSSKQMRVLWVSKSNGALAEYYNDPRLSVDAMKFYGDRIVSKEMADECELLLSHPELSVDELSELYQCICDGVDYSSLIGLSPVNIQIEREKQVREYWGDCKMFDPDYYDKALNVARQLKGY